MSQKRICLVNCYFGGWPKCISLFIESCRRNPLVDFIIITDCEASFQIPDNVTVVSTSFKAFRKRVERRLGMKPALDRPYKLCDFKTAYGVILEDYLDEYDFWGCTDLDLVYGGIHEFITDDLLDANDVIAARPWYLTGFFFLFRNHERVNRLYQQSQDYERVYQNSDNFCFDECNFAWQQLRAGASIFELDTEIESMTEVIRREERNGLRVHFNEMARESVGTSSLLWDRGSLTEGEKEWLLFHFVVQKDNWAFSFPDWEEVPETYTISPFGLWKGEGRFWAPLRDIRWTRLIRAGGEKLLRKANLLRP